MRRTRPRCRSGGRRRVLSGLAPPPLAEESSVGYRAASHRGRTKMRCLQCGSEAVTERPERTAQGYRRFRCRACGKQFNERSGTLLNRTQYPSDVIALVVLWRLRDKLSLRDLPEMFAVRGIVFWASPRGVDGSVRNPSTPGEWNGTETSPKAVHPRG